MVKRVLASGSHDNRTGFTWVRGRVPNPDAAEYALCHGRYRKRARRRPPRDHARLRERGRGGHELLRNTARADRSVICTLPWRRALYLGDLAVRYTRNHAPENYGNDSACRDGGSWEDLFPARTNLK